MLIGKIGTDIKDFKCSWIVVQLMKAINANPSAEAGKEDMLILKANYGKDEAKHEVIVKELYNKYNMVKIFKAEEDRYYELIDKEIRDNSAVLPAELFLPILNKIYQRKK
jgi:farnesyl diphosphate synthase